MIVGVPKEIKNNEFRVGMTPSRPKKRRSNFCVLIFQFIDGLWKAK